MATYRERGSVVASEYRPQLPAKTVKVALQGDPSVVVRIQTYPVSQRPRPRLHKKLTSPEPAKVGRLQRTHWLLKEISFFEQIPGLCRTPRWARTAVWLLLLAACVLTTHNMF